MKRANMPTQKQMIEIDNAQQSTGAYEFDGGNLKTIMDSSNQANATPGLKQNLREVLGNS